MFDWNKPYLLLMEIKKKYQEKTNKYESYDVREWIGEIDEKQYHDFFENIHITQFEHYVLLKYNLIQIYKNNQGFGGEDSIYRECRSVVIDVKREQLVLTPYKKFFNLNEIEENQLEKVLAELKEASIVEVMDKLDGSMQSGRYYEGEFFMSGSKALDKNNSWRLQDGYDHLTAPYQEMLRDYPDYTFIFEYIGPKNQHVVSYKEEEAGLYVIGARNVFTGVQLSYQEVNRIVVHYEGVKMVRFEQKSVEEVLKEISSYQANEKEGWVLNIDGHFIKIKCDDYVNIHKTLSSLSSVNVLIEHIANGTYDDFLSKIPLTYQERVKKMATEVFHYIDKVEKEIQEVYSFAPKEDKKEFMKWTEENCSNEVKGYVRSKFLERKYHPLKMGKRYKKAKEIGLNDGYSALFQE